MNYVVYFFLREIKNINNAGNSSVLLHFNLDIRISLTQQQLAVQVFQNNVFKNSRVFSRVQSSKVYYMIISIISIIINVVLL